MPAPNDDLHAYGWELSKLRHATKDSKPGDTWPGRPVFNAPQTREQMQAYGHNAQFLCPKYLQMMLDAVPAVRKGAEKVRAAGYTPEALKKFAAVVVKAFEEVVLVDIAQNFFENSGLVAQFYAARLAHVDTFGPDEDEAAPEPEPAPAQSPAKTTKSRR